MTTAEIQGNRLIVPHENWRSKKIYAYCPSCDDVFGVPKGESLNCTGCRRACRDVFEHLVERINTIWRFFEHMRVQDGPFGLFRESDYPNPWSLQATYRALETRWSLVEYGFEEPYTPRQIDEWVQTILSYAHPESGLIEEPFAAEQTNRSQEFFGTMYNLSNRLAEVFKNMDKLDVYRVPLHQLQHYDHLTSRQSTLDFLVRDLWHTNPWGMGAQTSYQVDRHERILHETNQPDDGMVDLVHHWLDEHQDPQTGYWFGGKATMNTSACGAYKLICWLYRMRNWKINHLEKIVDTTLGLQTPRGDFGDNGYSCRVWDPMLLLKVGMDRLGDYRQEEIFDAAARVFLNVIDHWSDEEHTFTQDKSKPARILDLMQWAVVLYIGEFLLGVPIFGNE